MIVFAVEGDHLECTVLLCLLIPVLSLACHVVVAQELLLNDLLEVTCVSPWSLPWGAENQQSL